MGQAHRRGANGSIYAYKTKAGTRYRFVFRDARGKQTSRNGYVTRAAARKARKRLMGKVHRGELRVSRESLGACWGRYLTQRRPYLEDGSWQDYRRHGELRILPQLGDRKLTALTTPELPGFASFFAVCRRGAGAVSAIALNSAWADMTTSAWPAV